MPIFVFLFAVFVSSDIEIIREFQSPDLVSDEYLGDPYSMDFSPTGTLYVLDRLQATVHYWKPDGTYRGRFGKQGEGPGELVYPVKICAEREAVWVWDFHRRFTKFTRDGQYLKSFSVPTVEPRTFAVLKQDSFILGYRNVSDLKNIRFAFGRIDAKAPAPAQLLEIKSEIYLKTPGGTAKDAMKAFGPEGDIQRDDKGSLYIGYSQNNKIYRLDNLGQIAREISFNLPTAPPTPLEIEQVKAMELPAGGRRLVLTDMIDFDYSHHKAGYTHFLIKGNAIAFVLTPVGGLGVLNAFHQATFLICDLSTGKVLNRGAYAYPVDSRVFHRDGRSLAVISNDKGYAIKEIVLKGMGHSSKTQRSTTPL